jgi:phospholipase D1/2
MSGSGLNWLKVGRPMLATLATAGLPLVGVIALTANAGVIEAQLTAWPQGWAAAIVTLVGAALAGLALLPTHAVSLVMGWLFGPVLGCGLAIGAVTAAAAWGYFIGGRLAGTGLSRSLPADSRMARLRSALVEASSRRTTLLVALLRLSPAAPFAATNVAMAAVAVPWRAFLIGSVVGLAPRVIVVTLFGAALGQLDFQRPDSPALLALGGVATIAALAVSGHLARRALSRTVQPNPSAVLTSGNARPVPN